MSGGGGVGQESCGRVGKGGGEKETWLGLLPGRGEAN